LDKCPSDGNPPQLYANPFGQSRWFGEELANITEKYLEISPRWCGMKLGNNKSHERAFITVVGRYRGTGNPGNHG